MQIAVCDDDSDELVRITSIIDSYKREKKVSLSYTAFQSATELLSGAKCGDYDLYLLDVLMPAVNGMTTAREIRSFDEDTEIVFLTSSPEFAVESYQYRAMNYLLKPAAPEQLFLVLDALLAKEEQRQECLCIKTKTGMTRILFQRLSYVEVLGRRVYFHMADGSVCEMSATLAEFENVLLSRPEFVRAHRSYLVNLMQIATLSETELTTLSGDKVPVSRKNYVKLREAFVEQLFQRKERK